MTDTNLKYITRSYRLSAEIVTVLEDVTKRLSWEARIPLSMGKVLELLILHCQSTKFKDLLR